MRHQIVYLNNIEVNVQCNVYKLEDFFKYHSITYNLNGNCSLYADNLKIMSLDSSYNDWMSLHYGLQLVSSEMTRICYWILENVELYLFPGHHSIDFLIIWIIVTLPHLRKLEKEIWLSIYLSPFTKCCKDYIQIFGFSFASFYKPETQIIL